MEFDNSHYYNFLVYRDDDINSSTEKSIKILMEFPNFFNLGQYLVGKDFHKNNQKLSYNKFCELFDSIIEPSSNNKKALLDSYNKLFNPLNFYQNTLPDNIDKLSGPIKYNLKNFDVEKLLKFFEKRSNKVMENVKNNADLIKCVSFGKISQKKCCELNKHSILKERINKLIGKNSKVIEKCCGKESENVEIKSTCDLIGLEMVNLGAENNSENKNNEKCPL